MSHPYVGDMMPPPDPAARMRPPVQHRFRPQLEIASLEKQGRLGILFRLVLVVPHLVTLWVLWIGALVVVTVGWFCALVIGRLPRWAADYLTGYLAWTTRVLAYAMLLTGRYPEFSLRPDVGAVRIDVRPGRLNRAAVLFRFVLMLPANVVVGVLVLGWEILALFFWLIALVMGRPPRVVFEATAAVLRALLRHYSYLLMVSDAYPLVGVMADGGHEENPALERRSATRPLVLSNGATALLVMLIVLGAIGNLASNVVGTVVADRYTPAVAADADPDGVDDADESGVEVDAALAEMAYSTFVGELRHAAKKVRRCDRRPCVVKQFAEFEFAARDLAIDLHRIDFVAGAQEKANKLRKSALKIAAAARLLRSPDRPTHSETIRLGQRIDRLLLRCDRRMSRLRTALEPTTTAV